MRAIKENPCQFEHPRCGAGHLNICDMCYLRNIEGTAEIKECIEHINQQIEKLLDDKFRNINQRDYDSNGNAYRSGKIEALREIREYLRSEAK